MPSRALDPTTIDTPPVVERRPGRIELRCSTRDGLAWSFVLRRRLGLYQLAGAATAGAGTEPLGYTTRSVYEYAFEVVGHDGRRAWAGNGHRHEVPTGLRTSGDGLRRRSVLLDPTRRRPRPLARIEQRYRVVPAGLELRRTTAWLRDASLGVRYVGMFPVPPTFDVVVPPTGAPEPIHAGTGWKGGGDGPALTVRSGDLEATLEVVEAVAAGRATPVHLAARARRGAGIVKLYAAARPGARSVAAGEVDRATVLLSVRRRVGRPEDRQGPDGA